MKKIFISGMIMAFLVFCGCSKSNEVLLLLNKDESISLRRGEVLNIELEANPTTGYVWSVLTSDTESVLEQTGPGGYTPGAQAKSGLVGAGGIQTYRFTAVKRGESILVFQYSRSWEKDVEPVKRFVVQVTVGD